MAGHASDALAGRRKIVVVVGGLVAAIAVGLILFLVTNSSSCARKRAVWESEYGYGVERDVRLYSFDGELVESWSGRIDVEYRDDNRADLVFFDEDGNVVGRTVVSYGLGQLVVEQK